MGLVDFRNKLRDTLLKTSKPAMVGGLSPISIDFGTGALKILQVSREGPTCALVAAACLPTPEELLADPTRRLQFQAEALPKLIKAAPFRGKRTVCAIPASLSFCRHMKVPKDQGLPVHIAVEGALVQQFGCHPSQMVFRHFEVAELPKAGGGTQYEVICLAATRELVDRLMSAINNAKLEPVGMHCEQLALLRSFDPISRRQEDKQDTALYLDIGAGSTNMLIAQGQNLMFSKRIEMGGRYLDEAICKQIKCTIAEARQMREEMDGLVADQRQTAAAASFTGPRLPITEDGTLAMSGTVTQAVVLADDLARRAASNLAGATANRRQNESPVFSADVTAQPARQFTPPRADLTEAVEIVTGDVRMALSYYSALFPNRPIDRTIFVGGEARYKGLCQHIARQIRLSAQIADPLASVARNAANTAVGLDLNQPQPGWAVPMGLCLLPTDL